jgi:hypothetical protein
MVRTILVFDRVRYFGWLDAKANDGNRFVTPMTAPRESIGSLEERG